MRAAGRTGLLTKRPLDGPFFGPARKVVRLRIFDATHPPMKRLASLLILVLLLPAAFAQQLKLRILGTTDLHLNLLAW